MTKDCVIISAVQLIIEYCHKQHISIGTRGYLWNLVVMWARNVHYDDANKLAAAIIRDEYEPLSFNEIESLQRIYFSICFD